MKNTTNEKDNTKENTIPETNPTQQLTDWVNGVGPDAVLIEIARLSLMYPKVKRIGDGTDKEDNKEYLLALKKAEIRG